MFSSSNKTDYFLSTDDNADGYIIETFGEFSEENPDNKDLARCNIDINDIQSNVVALENTIRTSMTDGDDDAIIKVILSDEFYNNVNNLTNKITAVDFDKIKCLANNDKEKICSNMNDPYAVKRINELEKILDVLNKYMNVVKNISTWVYKNISDLYKYCNGDSNKVDKIKQIIARLSFVIADTNELQKLIGGTIPPAAPQPATVQQLHVEQSNTTLYVIIIALVIALITVSVMFYRKR